MTRQDKTEQDNNTAEIIEKEEKNNNIEKMSCRCAQLFTLEKLPF